MPHPPSLSLLPKAPRKSSADSLRATYNLQLTAFVFAVLYFGRDLLIPLALAILLTFLLSPLVTRLERWIGRIAAVLVVVAMIFSFIGAAGWALTKQSVDLAARLPDYKQNLLSKAHAFSLPSGGAFSKVSQLIDDLKKELPGLSNPDPSKKGQTAAPSQAPSLTSPGSAQPIPVKVVDSESPKPLAWVGSIVTTLLGPLGTSGLVFLLVICMLFQREDLRSRFIRLVGQGRISETTQAMDDAGSRVSKYLSMQLLVNIGYGVCIAIGLFFIGVPNAFLWGAFAMVLRFIPYAGPWIASVFPVLLTLAVSPSWMTPLITVGLFIGLELVWGNVLEPLLYGSHTGVSSMALIVAAVFWTWMWGTAGLVLAAPLTVCLVVIGRHVPRMAFLSILLSDEEALTTAEECYHRLLAVGLNEASELVDGFVKANSLTVLYDTVLIPVITSSEMDHQREALDDEQLTELHDGVRDIIEDLGSRPPLESKVAADVSIAEVSKPSPPPPGCHVICMPARSERDELAGLMLTQLLVQQGFEAENAPAELLAGELPGLVAKREAACVFISVIPPSTIIHARYLCSKLRAKFPKLKIAVGLWGASESAPGAGQRLRDAGADEVVVSLAEALVQMRKFAAV